MRVVRPVWQGTALAWINSPHDKIIQRIHESTNDASSGDVVNDLIQWGAQQDRVRAMLMTSTRAVPNVVVDEFSGYDIVLIVEDIHPFHEERDWLNDFGEVLVVYQDPIYPDPDTGSDRFGNVTQYADGLKIDFTLHPVQWLQKEYADFEGNRNTDHFSGDRFSQPHLF